MFCGYCGKNILDDMVFCPYCGKALSKEIYENTNNAVNEPEYTNSSDVSSDFSGDDWKYYNLIQVNVSDLPDIQDDYLVYGSDRLLRNDITRYYMNDDSFIIEDKYGKQIIVNLNGIGNGKALSALVSVVKDRLKQGEFEKRLWLQMARIAPLCGDDALKKHCSAVSNIISRIKNVEHAIEKSGNGIIISWLNIFNALKKVDDSELIVLYAHPFIVTNENLVNTLGGEDIKLNNIFEISKTNPGFSISLKYGTVKKYPLAIFTQEKFEVLSDCLNHYKQGRMDDFIKKEYAADSEIVKL